jgi:mRNA guanylyltransferase
MKKTNLINDNGPVVYEISDASLCKDIKNFIFLQWCVEENDTNYIPAPQPISLERKDLKKLITYEYSVCVKSDGMRFLLLVHEGKTYFIDRAFKIFQIDVEYVTKPNKYLLDGELIFTYDNKWSYIMHDCVNSRGKCVSSYDLVVRTNEIDVFLGLVANSEILFAKKQFFSFKKFGSLVKLLDDNKFNHKTDGFIFTPRNEKIGKFTQFDLFKWKPMSSHTFDFKIVLNNHGVIAYVNKNKLEEQPYACANKGSHEEIIFLEHLYKNCPEFKNGNIVECEFDILNGVYKPIKLRTDKMYPNSFFTVNKTLVNIKENITINELIALINY